MNISASLAAFERARSVIPGGVNSPARAFGAVGGTPLTIDRADGAYLFDIDGNRYIDFIGSWGPHILGHRHPAITQAVSDALQRGTSYGAPCQAETELAELIVDAVPSIEMVRMVNSGTEATMSAIRVARGFTRRNVLVKFAGCYHGHVDSLLVKAGSGALTHGVPTSPGVPAGCTADTVVLEYNDVTRLRELFATRGEEIAALILEPVVGNMGLVIPTTEFLAACRSLCTDAGAVLIFDEVMTGFRLSYGGAQELLGVTPDMTTLGKVIGAGLPVGAYGGRADIMSCVSPLGPVYQAGTLSGNPLAMAAGVAMLQTLQQEQPYQRLDATTEAIARGWASLAARYGLPHRVQRVGSMFTLFFTDQVVQNLTDALTSDTARFARFFHGMLDNGVYLACSQFEAHFVSAAIGEEEVRRTLTAAEIVLEQLARA